MSLKHKIKAGIVKIAAIGAVKRGGIGALQAYGGGIQGEGHVISKKTGKKTKFVLEGKPGQRA